jgi:hypothetical protein
MVTYVLRGLTSDLVARAKAKARDAETTLDAVLIRYLETYAEHGSIQSSGGHARKLALTATQRSAIARQGAAARWKDHDRGSSG